MPPTPLRRFSILDIMILVPAVAAGAWVLRPYLPGHAQMLTHLPGPTSDPWGLMRLHSWARGPGACLVVPLMAAVIALRLRPPRPRWNRLVGQPGFVACVAAMVSLLPGIVWVATIWHRPGFQQVFGVEQACAIATMWTDTAVLGAWAALVLSRRWRPEPSWVDRLGRALGFYWILMLFFITVVQWVQTIQQLIAQGGPL